MAYNRDKIYQQSIDVIKKHNLFFIEDIIAMLPCTKPTFYDYFPPDSDELNNLKGLLETNKTNTKVGIRAKLYRGDKAAELIALYKLICSEDERRALSMQQVEHSVSIGITGIEMIIPNEDKTKADS